MRLSVRLGVGAFKEEARARDERELFLDAVLNGGAGTGTVLSEAMDASEASEACDGKRDMERDLSSRPFPFTSSLNSALLSNDRGVEGLMVAVERRFAIL